MTRIQRLFAMLLLLAFVAAAWSQETPPAEAKPADTAKDAAPRFSARLLLVKADWSASPHAKEIEAELREALKDASVPKELLDKLPASGPEILFGPQTVALYSEEHHAELMAWLKAKDLILSQDKFERAPLLPKKEAEAKARSTAEQMVSRIDLNGDGVARKEEYLRYFGGQYGTADLDKDDILSLEELATQVEKEQRLWVENTIKLSKDDRFIELPKTGVGNRPFVKSQANLLWRVSWGIPGAAGPEGVAFSRQITVRDQLRGQEEPGEGKLVDNAYASVHIKEGRVLVMNAFPVPTEGEFRQAARAKGFEAVVMIGRALEKVPEVPARVHAPDWIDDRGDFGHEPQLDWGETPSPPTSLSFGSSGDVSEPAATKSPTELKFTAQFLLLKSDWSAVPAAKEIEAELREALKDVPVPKYLLDKLPASGSQILFGSETAGIYEPQRFAELVAWLKSKDLVVSVEAFRPTAIERERLPQGSSGMGSRTNSSSNAIWTTSATKGEKGFVDLSWITKPEPQPFVEYKPEVSWTVRSLRSSRDDSVSITLVARTIEESRGAPPGRSRNLFESQIKYPFPAGSVAITNAFGLGMAPDIRQYVHRHIRNGGIEAFIVVTGDNPFAGDKASSRLNLPDKVVPTQVTTQTGGASSPANAEAALTKIFHLQHASAAELRGVLLQLAAADIKLVVDERTNAIIVSGSASSLAELEAIALRLDEPADSAAEDKDPAPKSAGTVAELKQQYADAEREAVKLAKESKPAKDKLRAAVAKAFELRQKLLQAELAEFRERTERIEKSLQQRQGIKQQIIERRVEDLLKPGLEWDGAEEAHRPGAPGEQ